MCLGGKHGRLPALNHVPEALRAFQKSKEIEWTQGFSKVPIKEQHGKSFDFIEKYLLPIALVVVTLLGTLPESIRTQVIDFLERLQWTQLTGLLISAFLLYEFVSLLNRLFILDVESGDIKELLALQGDYPDRVLFSSEQSVSGL